MRIDWPFPTDWFPATCILLPRDLLSILCLLFVLSIVVGVLFICSFRFFLDCHVLKSAAFDFWNCSQISLCVGQFTFCSSPWYKTLSFCNHYISSYYLSENSRDIHDTIIFSPYLSLPFSCLSYHSIINWFKISHLTLILFYYY